MECVEAKALKNSFVPQMSLKSTQEMFSEDLWAGNGVNGVSGDDFFVENFLDFSNEDVVEHGFVEEEEEKGEGVKDCFSFSSQEQSSDSSCSFSVKDEFGSLPVSELCPPADDLANLEWLSHFVEDSFSEFSLQHLVGNPQEKAQTPNQSPSEPDMVKPSFRPTGFRQSVPSKARSKRSRIGGRVWSLSFTESSSSSSSSSSYSSGLTFNDTVPNLESYNCFGKPAAKKFKKKAVAETQLQRRCSHCGVQKTPQWRTGPMGAKTLCNACGVRYKSGRLLPEYRPACSPTFSSDVHSNNHRKVLEMRRKKEMAQPEFGLATTVQSF